MNQRDPAERQPRIWVTILIAILLLGLTEALLALYRPSALRLPEHFSSLYFERYVDRFRNERRPLVVVLGDSVLWGYGVSAPESAVDRLRRRFPQAAFLNLAYESATPADYDFLLRYLLRNGIRPRVVLLDVNTLAFNPFAPSYAKLNRPLERDARPLLESFDRDRITLPADLTQPTAEQKFDAFMQQHWALYGYRADIHQLFFRDSDFATALWNKGEARLRRDTATEKHPKYFGLYDLTPLSLDNISYAYCTHLFALLKAEHIPTVAFLPPVNHAVVGEYISAPAYGENLHRLQMLGSGYGIVVGDFDQLLSSDLFIDNAHASIIGNRRLADVLMPMLRQALK